MSEKVIIIGAGGHAKVVADIVLKSGDTLVGFLDDTKAGQEIWGTPILGILKDAHKYRDCRFVIGIGDNAARQRLSQEYQLNWYTAIHPSAVIAAHATIGCGTVVMAQTAVNSDASVGSHCIINTGAIVEHDCVLKDFVHLSPQVGLGGSVCVGNCVHIGIGAQVRNGVAICSDVIVGMGGVVVKNIVESGIYIGNPARRM